MYSMKKETKIIIFALLAIFWGTSSIQAQEVNTKRYITLTVKEGASITFNILADSGGSYIKIVSGNNEQIITAGNTFYTVRNDHTTRASIMTIYGNVRGLICSSNAENITGLDASHNTELAELFCSNNKLTALDISSNIKLEKLYCFGNLIPSIDISRNTELTELDCSDNQIVALDVSKNTKLTKLLCANNKLAALDARSNTKLEQLYCFGNLIPSIDVSSNTELTELDCSNNQIVALDVSKNTKLTKLLCANNKLVALDASNNTKLEQLYCFGNSLPQLDLKTNTYLSSLYCNENSLTSLDMSKNARLTFVNCRKNKLTLLDVTHNAELMGLIGDNNSIFSLDVSKSLHLTSLFCSENSLASLDISKNTQLKYLVCYGNNLSTVVLDDIYCALPDRKGEFSGVIRPSLNASSSENTKVIATNGSNATSKNWKVQYYESDTDITGFTGTHQCGGGTDIDDTKNNPSLIIYPNPVKDILHISSDKPMHSIRIYNMYGTEVLQTVDTNCINVSHLPTGIYMVRADNKIVRIIKE